MKIYIISDTHFGHDKIIEFCKRPSNHNEILMESVRYLPEESVLIHLGDFCFGNDLKWHEEFMETMSQ